MNGYSRRDRKSGDAKVAGLSRSPLLCLPIQSNFFGHGKNQELLLPSASDCAGSGAIAKDQRRRLDEERLAGFNHSADLSTHRRKNSVRTTRATAIHKIGVTGGKVETRIANAENEATYLLAKVEVVSTCKLAGINRAKVEGLFHRLFAPARLNVTINDRFGHPVQPEEWFLVPLFVIDEAVRRIRDGTITQYTYEPKEGKLVKAGAM